MLKKLVNDFADFAVKGNMIDMAVGIIMGAAFGTIIKSLVDDIISPPLGLALGGVDFTELKIVIDGTEGEDNEVAIRYGLFINSCISFVIVAMCLFFLVLMVNNAKKLKKKEEEEKAAEAPPRQEELLAEIRDIMALQAGIKPAKTVSPPASVITENDSDELQT